ncbi:hypothetical protein PM082_013154 [Marasmius tenuissimus]|nr:hypothetical protein PM082_013154 [Marasmius tenuissimus]
MSEWFRSVPYMLDAAAYAAKFQQESMAAQIRLLKTRHHQQRLYIDKLKREIAELRRTNELLQHNKAPLHYPSSGEAEYNGEPTSFVNQNGKRPIGGHWNDDRSPSMSSPRLISTPIGLSRLTLPPGQKPPHLSSKHADSPSDPDAFARRPGSSHFTQEFAYDPSPTRPAPVPVPRPSASSRPLQPSNIQKTRSSQMMPPPPAPRSVPLQRSTAKPINPPAGSLPPVGAVRSQPLPPIPSNTRTIPSTSSGIPLNRFQGSISQSRAPSRANPSLSGGGQRMPFVPR